MIKKISTIVALVCFSLNARAGSPLDRDMSDLGKEALKCLHPNAKYKYSDVAWEIDENNKPEDHLIDLGDGYVIFEKGESVVKYETLAPNEIGIVALQKITKSGGLRKIYIKINIRHDTSWLGVERSCYLKDWVFVKSIVDKK